METTVDGSENPVKLTSLKGGLVVENLPFFTGF